MATLPEATRFTDSDITEGNFKDAMTDLIDYLKDSTGGTVFVADGASGYNRTDLFESDHTTITVKAGMSVLVNTTTYSLTKDVTLNLDDYLGTADERAGVDAYIYAVEPESGTEPEFVLSLNSTVPDGYTEVNSRKIGGFHCICLAYGDIEDHWLSGYATGDVLPTSIWDLRHRAYSENEGMCYDELTNLWWDIYLEGWDGEKLISAFGETIMDGSSSPTWHGEKFNEYARYIKKRLPSRDEFTIAAEGTQAQMGKNVNGSNDKGTTGGWTNTSGTRIVSRIGLEDPWGVMWQWTSTAWGSYGGSSWSNTSVYNSSVDSYSKGSVYGGAIYRVHVGAYWDDGSNCGSRAIYVDGVSANVYAASGARCVAEPRIV